MTSKPQTWKSAMATAWHEHASRRYPQSRLAIRQACAYGLALKDWRAVYEGFVILSDARAKGEQIPGYFQTYLDRAIDLPSAQQSHLACRVFSQVLFTQKKTRTAMHLANRAVHLALDSGLYGDALRSAQLLLPNKTNGHLTHESVQAWIAIARTTLSARFWNEALQAAGLMHKAGLSGLARQWINRAASMALTNKDAEAVTASCALLSAAGYPDEAAIWRMRLTTPEMRSSNGDG